MNGYLTIIDKIKAQLETEEFVNSITEGSLFDVDFNKVTIFPLVHIIVNNFTFDERTITCNLSILAMDNVDVSTEQITDDFVGNDNVQWVTNTTLLILNRLYQQLKRGDLYDDGFQVLDTANVEPFQERFENLIAGNTMTLDVVFQNDMSIC